MLTLLVLALAGCSAQSLPPSVQPDGKLDALDEATDALLPEIQPAIEEEMVEQREVTLYFRMQNENLLASESRTVFFPKDKQVEQVLIDALTQGPSAGLLDLTGLFSAGTKVSSVIRSDTLLTVTLTPQFLSPPSGAPELWEQDPTWRAEVLTRRQLALASIVNTITEATNYTAVQFLVLDSDEATSGRRIRRAELYDGAPADQLLAPVVRSEQYLLTHFNTANIILQSWREQAFDRVFRFIAQEDAARPTDAAFTQEMISMDRPLVSYSLSAGTVSENGQKAVLEASFEYKTATGTISVQNFPLTLTRENGLWKISYSELKRMMEAV